MSETQEMYPLGRDKGESRRLNEQHRFLLDVVDGVIDRNVPLGNISAVADVATGTGVWLWDAKHTLDERVAPSERYFHGFDISDAQFPSTPQSINLSIQDVFKPFPAEFLNRFDLVHVRLMVTAFPESKFQEAVENVLTILIEPGGYLQWVEIDFSAVEAQTGGDARVASSAKHWMDFVDMNQMSRCAPDALSKAYKNLGMLNVVNTSFLIRGRPELKERAQTWQLQFFSSIMPLVLVRIGEAKDKDEASEKTATIINNLKSYFADGEVIDTRFGSVVGLKPV